MSRQIGVYYETWIEDKATKASEHSLALIEKPINTVYLSFAKPNIFYATRNFSGTGLEFNSPFDMIVGAIKILKSKGIKVFLSVGGAAHWHKALPFHGKSIGRLINDLGCDGIDLDWEVGYEDRLSPVQAVREIRPILSVDKKIIVTCFSTGAFEHVEKARWRGMNIDVLKSCGDIIDQVNVMAYDAGTDFEEVKSVAAYQRLYGGTINLGFQVGRHAWGGAILYYAEAKVNLRYIKETFDGGCFIWAYRKDGNPGISVTDLISLATVIFNPAPPPKPTYSCPSSVYVLCPNCDHRVKLSVADGGAKV